MHINFTKSVMHFALSKGMYNLEHLMIASDTIPIEQWIKGNMVKVLLSFVLSVNENKIIPMTTGEFKPPSSTFTSD